jgi:hypothetical protein
MKILLLLLSRAKLGKAAIPAAPETMVSGMTIDLFAVPLSWCSSRCNRGSGQAIVATDGRKLGRKN